MISLLEDRSDKKCAYTGWPISQHTCVILLILPLGIYWVCCIRDVVYLWCVYMGVLIRLFCVICVVRIISLNMKQKITISLLFLLLVSLASCKDDLQEGNLEVLSPLGKDIVLTSQSTSVEVEVRTNHASWTSSTNANWVLLFQEGNKLSIQVKANVYPSSRSAQVIVLSGGKSEVLTLEQAGSTTPFIVSSDQIVLGRWADSGDIHVDTYLKEWMVESNADWIRATAVPHENRIAVVVDAFEQEGERIATLTLSASAGKIKGTITIVQKGRERYILPYIAWGQDISAIMTSERGERRSELIAVPAPPSALNPQPYRYYTYKTNHPLFPEVHYETLELSDQFVFRAIMTAQDASILRSEEFIAYLKAQGYEPEVTLLKNSGNFVHTYINKDKKTRACLQVDSKGQRIFFVPVVEQPSTLPTLPTLSLGMTDFRKATPEDVRSWEEGRQSSYDAYKSTSESKTAGMPVEIYHAVAPFYTHTYIFSEKASTEDPTKVIKQLAQSSHILNDLGLVFYKWGDLYLVTKEFAALMAQEGFVLVEYDSYTYLYLNRDKQLLLWMKTSYWRDGQKPSFNIIPLY